MSEKITVEDLKNEFPQAKSFKKAPVKWNGYSVIYPIYHGSPKIGLPIVILEKNGEARLSNGYEGLKCMNYLEDVKLKNSDVSELRRKLITKM